MPDLVQLMEMQYQRSQQELKLVLEQETSIRAELATLHDHKIAAQQLGINDEPEMRAMGADVIWEKWLEKSTVKLNLNLARILATKEVHLVNVRKSFGKLQAANAKLNEMKSAGKRREQVQNLERTISHAILKNQ